MHIRFLITSGTHCLDRGGKLVHMSKTGSKTAAESCTLKQKDVRSRFQSLSATRRTSETILCFHFSLPNSSFALHSVRRRDPQPASQITKSLPVGLGPLLIHQLVPTAGTPHARVPSNTQTFCRTLTCNQGVHNTMDISPLGKPQACISMNDISSHSDAAQTLPQAKKISI